MAEWMGYDHVPNRRWFRVGERVVLTKRALAQGLQGRASSPAGRVVEVRSGYNFKVHRDGLRHAQWWSPLHWRRPRPGEVFK